jgi:hypothetical protein
MTLDIWEEANGPVLGLSVELVLALLPCIRRCVTEARRRMGHVIVVCDEGSSSCGYSGSTVVVETSKPNS